MTSTRDYEFCICTGSPKLRSNWPEYIELAQDYQERGWLTIYEGLKKKQYYDILANSQAQFNCALQDFVSFTLLEASALGTPSLLPAHLSFPETVNSNRHQLYVPWSVEDAFKKLHALVFDPPSEKVISFPAYIHDQALTHAIRIMTNDEYARTWHD